MFFRGNIGALSMVDSKCYEGRRKLSVSLSESTTAAAFSTSKSLTKQNGFSLPSLIELAVVFKQNKSDLRVEDI